MSGNFVNQSLENIPLEHLISTPLMAAGKAQKQLAETSVEFIKSFLVQTGPDGVDTTWDVDSVGEADQGASDALTVSFKYTRKGTREPTAQEITDGASAGDIIATSTDIVYEVPLLAIVWVPSLFVDRVYISFETEITSVKKSDFTLGVKASSSKWFSPVDVSVTAKFASSKQNAIKSSYFVEVEATDRGYNTGLDKVMTAITEGIGQSNDTTAE